MSHILYEFPTFTCIQINPKRTNHMKDEWFLQNVNDSSFAKILRSQRARYMPTLINQPTKRTFFGCTVISLPLSINQLTKYLLLFFFCSPADQSYYTDRSTRWNNMETKKTVELVHFVNKRNLPIINISVCLQGIKNNPC